MWSMAVATIVIAIAAAFVIRDMNEYASERTGAQIVLADVKEHGDHQQLAEFEAITAGDVSPAIAREIDENRREMTEGLDELERLGVGDGQVARLRETRSVVETAMDEELRLIRAGQIEQAEAVDEERVDPAFERLHVTVDEISARLADAARRTDRIADVGTYAINLLAAIALVRAVLEKEL
jgi:hypothetical protein